MAVLEELQAAVSTVTERIGPATVTIGRDRRGTGVVIGDGRVLTNAHNLRDRTTQVSFADGHAGQAELLGADSDGDLAVLAIDTQGVRPAEWSPDEPVTGSVVFPPGPRRQGPARHVRAGGAGSTGCSEARAAPGITEAFKNTPSFPEGSPGRSDLQTSKGRWLGNNTHRLRERFLTCHFGPGPASRIRFNNSAGGNSKPGGIGFPFFLYNPRGCPALNSQKEGLFAG